LENVGFRDRHLYLRFPEWGREADIIGVGELKFPNDYSAHHIHAGRASVCEGATRKFLEFATPTVENFQ